MKTDKKIAAQIALHFVKLDCDDNDYLKAREAILKFAKTSHRWTGAFKVRKSFERLGSSFYKLDSAFQIASLLIYRLSSLLEKKDK